MAEGYCFWVNVEFEDDVGGVPAYRPLVIAVMRTPTTMTAAAAVAHCLEITSLYYYPADADGTPGRIKQVTRIHHKDDTTGERFNIKSCSAVREEPYAVSETPRISSFADAPKKDVS